MITKDDIKLARETIERLNKLDHGSPKMVELLTAVIEDVRTKAWNEEVPGRQYLFGDVDTGTGSDPCFDEESKPEDEARCRLAAQAPAMARLLLKLHVYDDGLCGVCGGTERVDTFGERFESLVDVPHEPDCELAIVLRAAGVLPP